MTTILTIFAFSFIMTLLITPLIGKLGVVLGALDFPDHRKVHENAIPRTGGLSIFLVFILSLLLIAVLNTNVSNIFILDKKTAFFLLGALICFSVGLADDFHRIKPSLKFLFQIIGASMAFLGGLKVGQFDILGIKISFGSFDYFLTIFWFLVFINAVNLIDGLDGLASGIIMFTSILMTTLSVLDDNLLSAMLFSSLAGVTLAFLRYNFKPASIFLGDGGSYFLGYMIAGLSIMGLSKSQVSAAILIPLLALGIPLFDTMLSPIRRFASGKKLFMPDDDHVHHRLLKLGFSTNTVVFFIYTITLILCLAAVILVNIRNEVAGLFLIVIGAAAVIFFRKLGYTDYFSTGLLSDWIENLSDDFGIRTDYRRFTNMKNNLIRSQNYEELWKNVIQVLELLGFDKGSLYLNAPIEKEKLKVYVKAVPVSKKPDRREVPPIESSVIMRKSPPELDWIRPPFEMENYICSRCILRLELPLLSKDNNHFGTLVLVKDTRSKRIGHQSLKRVEDLRRTTIRALENIENKTKRHE